MASEASSPSAAAMPSAPPAMSRSMRRGWKGSNPSPTTRMRCSMAPPPNGCRTAGCPARSRSRPRWTVSCCVFRSGRSECHDASVRLVTATCREAARSLEFGPPGIAAIAVAGYAALAALQMREMKFSPAHAVAGDATIHFLGVLESVREAVVEAVVTVDADEWAPFLPRDFLADQHEISPKIARSLAAIC